MFLSEYGYTYRPFHGFELGGLNRGLTEMCRQFVRYFVRYCTKISFACCKLQSDVCGLDHFPH